MIVFCSDCCPELWNAGLIFPIADVELFRGKGLTKVLFGVYTVKDITFRCFEMVFDENGKAFIPFCRNRDLLE